MLMDEVLNIECLGIVRGMSPMEAVKEPLKTILILIGLLTIFKSLPGLETTIPKDWPQPSYL